MNAGGNRGWRENIGFYRRFLLDHFIIRSPSNESGPAAARRCVAAVRREREGAWNGVCGRPVLS